MTTFVQPSARLKNFLRGWLLVLGLKEGLVECATVCVKSVVILTDSTASNSENLIPTFKKEANTSLITSAGQTVYLHCHVENLGERSVRTLFLKFKYSEKAASFF